MVTATQGAQISRDIYEELKKTISSQVNRAIDSGLESIIENISPQVTPFLYSLWNARKNRAEKNGRLRDITVYLTLQMCGTNELTKDHLNVMAAGELYNMASYFQNWHLDDKKNVAGTHSAKLCHIASHLYREQAQKQILQTTLPQKTKLELITEIGDSNNAIQIGQSMELSESKISELEGKPKEIVIDTYKQRCKYMSGIFYGASFAMGAIMSQACEQKIDLFRQIGTSFGTGAQMINDVGDFCLVPSLVQLAEKDYQDQFADLRKGTMTLPIYELSQYVNIAPYQGTTLSEKQKEDILRKMIEKKCFHSTRKLSNGYFRVIKHLLKSVEKSEAKDMFSYMTGVFFYSNKFYRNLRENQGYVFG